MAETSSKSALLAFASSHLTPSDVAVLVERLAAGPGDQADSDRSLDLREVVLSQIDDPTASECLQELRRRQEQGLPLVPRWA